MKVVSIIVPIYNSEKYIDRCLSSLINQTYKKIEIVIVDDGSIDNSVEILYKYKNQDERIKVYTQENQGPSVARNTGLDKSTGDYVMFVDIDDYIDKDMIKFMIQNLNNVSDTMVLCDNQEIWKNSIDERKLFSKNDFNIPRDDVIKSIASGKAGLVCGKLFSRNIVEKNKIRFDEKIKMCEDQIFFLNVSRYCKKFFYVPKSLYFYDRRNENSITIKYQQNSIENQVYVIKLIEDLLNKCNLQEKDIKSIVNKRFMDSIQYCVTNEILDTKLYNINEKLSNIKNIVSNKKFQQAMANVEPKTIRENIVVKSFYIENYVLLYGSFYLLDKIINPSKTYIKRVIKKVGAI